MVQTPPTGSKGCALGGSRAEPWPYFPSLVPRAGNGHEVSPNGAGVAPHRLRRLPAAEIGKEMPCDPHRHRQSTLIQERPKAGKSLGQIAALFGCGSVGGAPGGAGRRARNMTAQRPGARSVGLQSVWS